MSSPRWLYAFTGVLVALAESAAALGAADLPDDLVVDIRVFEARSSTPDFKAMQELAFFINTDGESVTEDQWLATIARKAPDSFLATLAYESVAPASPTLALSLAKRSRTLRLSFDLSQFAPDGLFLAEMHGELFRRDESERSFEQTTELRVGQTSVWSGRELELSASEYLSYFRDYKDGDDRRELYAKLRNYATFLIVALTPRLTGAEEPSPVVPLEIPDGASIPDFQSPLGQELVGTVTLELDIDPDGTPTAVRIVRSSLPEVNSQLLGAVETWSFSEARGETGRLELELKASP